MLASVTLFAVTLLLATAQKPDECNPDKMFDRKEMAKAKALVMTKDRTVLLKERLKAAQDECDARFKEFLAGRGTLDILLDASQRRLKAELPLADTNTARVAAYERYWEITWQMETVNKARYDAGRIAVTDYAQSRFHRLDAEILLRDAMEKKEK